MILKPQINKFPMKLNFGQYSALGLKRQLKENRNDFSCLNVILRLGPRKKKEGNYFFPLYMPTYCSRSIYDCLYHKL